MAFAAPTAATDKSHVDAPDLDAQRLWTPEPEPSDSDGDTYTAWGRKHLGEDWYQQRSIMLKECDVYVPVDICYEDNDKEEMNLKFFQWNYQGFSREEQEQLGRMHGFPGRPLFPLQKDRIHCFRNFEELSEPTRPRPKPEKEMDRFLFLWKLFLSDKELAELARLYGFDTDKRPDGVLHKGRAGKRRAAA
ncbi:hypothetical protein B0T18DRAFT_424426 [Schizothecium vesticola]|uniref:Uncharacterized protein n=1 Tax=Schizothecium vesticola TaxID=314040 RepID=A0AA40FA32_9PEZI|nr:hypothetical protein B0T18DRAFT_424426 [Schizothecium vesticola]